MREGRHSHRNARRPRRPLEGGHAKRFAREGSTLDSSHQTIHASHNKAMLLASVFDDPEAKRALRKIAADRSAQQAERVAAIEALVQNRDPEMVPILSKLLNAGDLRMAAARAGRL